MVYKWVAILFCGLFISQVQASPDIKHWQTSNDAQVYYVHAPELPMVDIQVIFDAGAARDRIAGTALLTNAMLNEGAAGLSTNQIAAGFDDLGAQFGNTSARDMAVLSLRSLTETKTLQSALDLFSKVLAQADFPQDSFERLQKQVLISLQAEKQSPGAIANRQFYKALYGEHPYAAMPIGDEASVPSLTVDTLKQFYQRYYVANNAVVVIVGALDLQQATDVAEQVLATLPVGEKAATLPAVKALSTAESVQLDHPTSQTHVVIGQPGMSRHDPDYFALYVGNHILGGSGLVSRLSNEVREKRGLSYSVYSYFGPMRELGPYQIGLQTRNDQAQQALDVVYNTMRSFINNGPTEQELIAAQQNITGGFALRVDSNSKIADYLAMIGFYGLPLDYLDTFISKVNSVTTEQIKQAFSKRVDVDKMVTILVGGEAEKK